MYKRVLFYLIISTFIFFTSVSANIIHVPGTQPTIQDGINVAMNGDTVLVANGTYVENINFKGKAITVASNFIMDGDTNHIDNTIIDGSQPSHPDSGSVVYFAFGEDTTSVLCGFTITGGSGTYFAGVNRYGGGGILMTAGGKIRYNKITGNQVHVIAQQEIGGGGLLFFPIISTNLIIEYNDLISNSLSGPVNANGGGLWLGPRWNDGFIRVNNNLISNNSVTCTGTYKALGGGIGLSIELPTRGTIFIEKNLISNNELHCVASVGGGIYIVYWNPVYIITDNNPSPVIRNNIISNNYSEGIGGGIGVWTVEHGTHYPNSNIKPQPSIINNTIANNIAQDGCGIFNFDSYSLLLNNILWDDLSVSGSNEIFDGNINFAPYVPPYHDPINDGEVFVRYSDIRDILWQGMGNISANPQFANNTTAYQLSDISPCIEAGIDSIEVEGVWYKSPNTCFMGHPRPSPPGTDPDMGACESFYTGICQMKDKYLLTYQLSQNYPNPFNPTTTIEFDLPKSSEVSLKVFNIIGEEVVKLVSAKLSAGSYSYEWDASNFANSVYLYRLQAGNYVETRKMVLMR